METPKSCGHYFKMEHITQTSMVENEANTLCGVRTEDENDDLEAPSLLHWYCPLTQAVMKDPVVHPISGETYERNAIEDGHCGGRKYYPNRALKEYIESSVAEMNGTRSKVGDQPVKAFQCSITFDLMRDPVIDPDGYSYERAAIVDWIEKHGTSPNTREKLTIDQLADNKALFAILFDLIRTGELVNAETEQWMTDLSTPSTRPEGQSQNTLINYRASNGYSANNVSATRATHYAPDHTGRHGRPLDPQQADRKRNCSLILLCILFFAPAIVIGVILIFALSVNSDSLFDKDDSDGITFVNITWQTSESSTLAPTEANRGSIQWWFKDPMQP